MIEAIPIIREVYSLWQNPSSKRLIPEDVVDALNRVYSQRLLQFGLSGGNYLAKVSETFTFETGTQTVSIRDGSTVTDLMSEIRLEAKASTSVLESDWTEVFIGNYADWSSYLNSDKPYAAFYGSTDDAQMVVNFDPANQIFRLFYEHGGNLVGQDGGEIEMPQLFQPLLVYDTAIEAGELLDDESDAFAAKYKRKMPYLVMRQSEALRLFERWLTERKSQSVQTREGFGSKRNNGIYGKNWRVTIPDGGYR